jgi:hypothetical protein
MRVHLVNPSDISFGVAVITPRWLYVLAAATPAEYGTPHPTMSADDSARHVRAGKMARLIAKPCRGLFVAKATA